MDSKSFLTTGVAAGLVMFIVMMITSTLTQTVFAYDVATLGGMRAINDPLMALFMLSPLVMAFAMLYAYPYVSGSLKGDWVQKGKKYGLLVWVVHGLPSAFVVYTSMNYPLGFTVDSVLGSLVYLLAGALTITKLVEKKPVKKTE